jgi:hypothetical protein
MKRRAFAALLSAVCLSLLLWCEEVPTQHSWPTPTETAEGRGSGAGGRPRLALWLAKKDELIEHERARYDLVMTGWFEPAEAETMRSRCHTRMIPSGIHRDGALHSG